MKKDFDWPWWKEALVCIMYIVAVLLPQLVCPVKELIEWEVAMFVIPLLIYIPWLSIHAEDWDLKVTRLWLVCIPSELLIVNLFLIFGGWGYDDVVYSALHPVFYIGYLIVTFIIEGYISDHKKKLI